MTSSDELQAYLDSRAARYDGTSEDMLEITPDPLQTPGEIQAFWESKHLSHIESQNNNPELASEWSNILPEDPAANVARGSDNMNLLEVMKTHADNIIDAICISFFTK